MLIKNIKMAPQEDEAKYKEMMGLEKDHHTISWPLPNHKRIEEKEFWGWRASYSFEAEIWGGQIEVLNEEGKVQWANLMVYILNHSTYKDGGFAVLVFRDYRKERVEYYSWRKCEHSFKGKTIGNCLNRYTCEKCDYYYDIDSSG